MITWVLPWTVMGTILAHRKLPVNVAALVCCCFIDLHTLLSTAPLHPTPSSVVKWLSFPLRSSTFPPGCLCSGYLPHLECHPPFLLSPNSTFKVWLGCRLFHEAFPDLVRRKSPCPALVSQGTWLESLRVLTSQPVTCGKCLPPRTLSCLRTRPVDLAVPLCTHSAFPKAWIEWIDGWPLNGTPTTGTLHVMGTTISLFPFCFKVKQPSFIYLTSSSFFYGFFWIF